VLLDRSQVENLKPVQAFLKSKEINSINTSKAYLTALVHFNNFLSPGTTETILQSLTCNKQNVYELLNLFLADQLKKVSKKTAILHLHAITSYLGFHDVDIIPNKFKKKVTVPKLIREDEQAIDIHDVRKILLKCDNRRLKAYLLVLASGGMRTVEGLAIRIKDIDFNVNPTKVHIRGDISKTRIARDIYISDETTKYLQDWIDWKYRNGKSKDADDIVFGLRKKPNPMRLYADIAHEFAKIMDSVGFAERKDNSKRRKVTLNSLRRFVDTTVSDSAGKDYAEWFLGHNKSPYWTRKEQERREIYATKCMKYLTFLDYTTLEARGKGIEANLQEKDKEIKDLEAQIKLLITNQTEMSRRLYEAGILKKN
jgi:integrase